VDFGLDFGATDIKTAAGFLDIFITKVNSNGTYGWTKTISGSSSEDCFAIAVDLSGNIYLTGDFWGVVDFGLSFGASDVRTCIGEHDLFITKIKADLTYGWTHTQGYQEESGNAVAVDPSGNVYVTGMELDERDYSTGILIYKFNADGTWGWSKGIWGDASTEGGGGQDIAVDGSGNVFITGSFHGTLDFGQPFGTTDTKTSMGTDMFVLKINSDGTYGWTKRMGGTELAAGSGVALDVSGNVYVAGYFRGTVDFGLDFGSTEIKTSGGFSDIFITKINSDATFGWTKVMGGTEDDEGCDVTIDSSGNAYVTGFFRDSANFSADFGVMDSKTSAGGCDVFLTKLDLAPTDFTVPKHAVGDLDGDGIEEIAVDFGAMGAWIWNGGTWTVLTALDPECMLAADVNGDHIDELILSLSSGGLWLVTAGVGQGLSSSHVETMAAGDIDADGADEVVGDFGALGLWVYNGGVWTQLSGVNADYVITADVDKAGTAGIAGDFGIIGLWIWKAGVWTQLSGVNPDHLTSGKLIGGMYLLCDFGASGLWAWTELGAWTNLSGANADYMITADTDAEYPDDFFADFGSLGLWFWDSAVWSQISGANAVYMIPADVNGDGKDELAVDFGTVGLWLWNSGAWSQLGGAPSENLVAGDFDGDSKNEILADLGASGLWIWDSGVWSQISGNNPD